MEYLEAPSIQSVSRRHQYAPIRWLSKARFEELVDRPDSRESLKPYLDDPDRASARIYIGKTIQSHTSEGISHGYDYLADQKNPPRMNLEIIGSVVRNFMSGLWELHVSHASGHHVIKQDFLVLCIEDENTFEWVATKKNKIPRNALRGCIDRFTNEYFYIGRTRPQDTPTKPGFFRYPNWVEFSEPIPARFGKVHVSHQCLYIGFNNIEIKFDEYDVLCLRPTPAPLSILARCYIRELLAHSNERVERINESGKRRRLPENLVQFLKYPSHLSVGEYMIKGERLVREDGKYELLIESNDQLVCRSVIRESDIANLSPSDLEELKARQIVNIITYHPADSIWLHRFNCVVYQKNARLYILKNFFDRAADYQLAIKENGGDDGAPTIEIIEINGTTKTTTDPFLEAN